MHVGKEAARGAVGCEDRSGDPGNRGHCCGSCGSGFSASLWPGGARPPCRTWCYRSRAGINMHSRTDWRCHSRAATISHSRAGSGSISIRTAECLHSCTDYVITSCHVSTGYLASWRNSVRGDNGAVFWCALRSKKSFKMFGFKVEQLLGTTTMQAACV